jgi:hypothetical protein
MRFFPIHPKIELHYFATIGVNIAISFQKKCETQMACIYILSTSKLQAQQQLMNCVDNWIHVEVLLIDRAR